MAQRDRSQGFGFMYVDISKLIQSQNELAAGDAAPLTTAEVKTLNFNKDRQAPTSPAAVSAPELKIAPPPQKEDRQAAIKQIKENLDRLQSLHHKLHAMLEELNRITDKTPKQN